MMARLIGRLQARLAMKKAKVNSAIQSITPALTIFGATTAMVSKLKKYPYYTIAAEVKTSLKTVVIFLTK